MTIREFARLCDVSPATASRFFSGQGRISEEKRAVMEKMARKTDYQPRAGYHTRRKQRNAIVAVLPDFRHSFCNNMAELLRLHAAACGRQLVIVQSSGPAEEATLSLLASLSPLGVILLSDHPDDTIADALAHRGIPAVICGGLPLGRKLSAVHIDDIMAAYDGTRYLIGLGHRRIGFLSDNTRAISSGFQRIIGCRRAMHDAGFSLPDEQIAQGETTFAGGYQAMDDLLSAAPHVTAVFAFSDDMAVGAAARLWEAGKRIPADVSLLGFDDSMIGRQMRPGLCTMRQPNDQIARTCITRLLEVAHVQDVTSLVLPHELVERESCRRL